MLHVHPGLDSAASQQPNPSPYYLLGSKGSHAQPHMPRSMCTCAHTHAHTPPTTPVSRLRSWPCRGRFVSCYQGSAHGRRAAKDWAAQFFRWHFCLGCSRLPGALHVFIRASSQGREDTGPPSYSVLTSSTARVPTDGPASPPAPPLRIRREVGVRSWTRALGEGAHLGAHT